MRILALFFLSCLTAFGQLDFTSPAMPSFYLPPVIAVPNPNVAWYKFTEGSGALTASAVGTGNTGVLTNSPTWSTGPTGNGALNFNGTNQFVDVTNKVNFNFVSNVTITAWVKYSAGQINSFIISKYNSGSSLRAYYLGLENANDGTRLMFTVQQTGGSFNTSTVASSTVSTADNNWHFVAGIFSANNKLSVWVDSTLYNASSIPASCATNSIDVMLGSGNGIFFNGSIADVRFFSSALTTNQLILIKNAGAQ